jgi:ribosomal protein S18 acetylase RimI-like enzyme
MYCFYGFSTFSAKPLLNVHDLVVHESMRGMGVGTQLLQAAENEAKEKGCCKITLEVLQNNTRAQKVYQSFGFAGYHLGSEDNNALFWQKKF